MQPDTRVRFVTDGAEGVIVATVAHGSPQPVEYDVRLVDTGVLRARVSPDGVYPIPVDLDALTKVFNLIRDAMPDEPTSFRASTVLMGADELTAELMWRRALLDELLAAWRDVPDFPARLTVETGAPELAALLGQLDRLDEQWHTYKPGDLVRVTYTDDATGVDVSYWARVIGPAKREGDYEVEVVHVGRGSRVKVCQRCAPIRTASPGLYGGPIRFVPARSIPGGDE